MNYKLLVAVFFGLVSCKNPRSEPIIQYESPYIFVLGVAQDAGYPQAGCKKECCQRVYRKAANRRYVSSIALVDPFSKEYWIFDASPDFREQLKMINDHLQSTDLPNGIFLTHAHMGHYTGLMHLGREAMSAKEVPVFAMPRMRSYLLENGPWSQLVSLENIDLNQLQDEEPIVLNERLSVIPFKVPHRDEFSETVGFQIVYKKKKAIFIPDIDKWDKWDEDIVAIVQNNDIALLDATFFKDGEIKGRPMSEIPHPFVEESMKLFEALTIEDKSKIYFTHFNHTNPLLIDGSDAQRRVLKQGFNLAIQEAVIDFK